MNHWLLFFKWNGLIREFRTKIIALHIFCNRLKYFFVWYGAISFRCDVSYRSYQHLLMMDLYVFYEPQVNVVFQNSFQMGLGKIFQLIFQVSDMMLRKKVCCLTAGKGSKYGSEKNSVRGFFSRRTWLNEFTKIVSSYFPVL